MFICIILSVWRANMIKHTVIRVLRRDNGQNCRMELTFDYKIDAEYYAEQMNRLFGTQKLNWIVDSY